MNAYRIVSLCILAALLAISFAAAFNDTAALQQGPPDGQHSVDLLTRGPVYEAFAEAVTSEPQSERPVLPPISSHNGRP